MQTALDSVGSMPAGINSVSPDTINQRLKCIWVFEGEEPTRSLPFDFPTTLAAVPWKLPDIPIWNLLWS